MVISSTTFTAGVIAGFSIFIDMLTISNLESKLMPVKKYLKNMFIVIVVIGIGLSISIHLIMFLSGDTMYFKDGIKNDADKNNISFLIAFLIVTVLSIMLILCLALMALPIQKIFSIKSEYFIENSNSERWKIIKATRDKRILLGRIHNDSKIEYKFIDKIDEGVIISEEISLGKVTKHIYKNFIKCTLGIGIITFCMLIVLKFCELNMIFTIIFCILFIIGVELILFLVSFKINMKTKNIEIIE